MWTGSSPTLSMTKISPATSSETVRPAAVKLHRRSRILELVYNGAESLELSAEYLRVFSPSAEVQGHGPGAAKLITGKQEVAITGIEPQGSYAIRLIFDDGHDTGIYTWALLKSLAEHFEVNWRDYLLRVRAAAPANVIASSSSPGVKIHASDKAKPPQSTP